MAWNDWRIPFVDITRDYVLRESVQTALTSSSIWNLAGSDVAYLLIARNEECRNDLKAIVSFVAIYNHGASIDI